MKRCNSCGLELPKSCFYKNRNSPDGLDYTCKGCSNNRQKASRAAKKESFRILSFKSEKAWALLSGYKKEVRDKIIETAIIEYMRGYNK